MQYARAPTLLSWSPLLVFASAPSPTPTLDVHDADGSSSSPRTSVSPPLESIGRVGGVACTMCHSSSSPASSAISHSHSHSRSRSRRVPRTRSGRSGGGPAGVRDGGGGGGGTRRGDTCRKQAGESCSATARAVAVTERVYTSRIVACGLPAQHDQRARPDRDERSEEAIDRRRPTTKTERFRIYRTTVARTRSSSSLGGRRSIGPFREERSVARDRERARFDRLSSAKRRNLVDRNSSSRLMRLVRTGTDEDRKTREDRSASFAGSKLRKLRGRV